MLCVVALCVVTNNVAKCGSCFNTIGYYNNQFSVSLAFIYHHAVCEVQGDNTSMCRQCVAVSKYMIYVTIRH